MKRRIAWILIGAIISGAYYLLNSPRPLQQTILNGEKTESDLAGFASVSIDGEIKIDSIEPEKNSGLINSGVGTGIADKGLDIGRRLEIFGQVVDGHNQPIDDALVAEERYFHNTRTDSEGKYKIFVDWRDNQYPVLRFLRSGFQDKRVQLDTEELKNKPVVELDVTLADDSDSISVDGWVGNDIGVGLGGLKIRITSRNNQGLDIVFNTVFSDERGNFTLDGIKAGDTYKLTIFSTPAYLFYVDEELVVTQNSPQLNIVLKSLDFVDIDGMIVNSKAEPIPNFEIYISNKSTGTHTRKIVSDSSGFFSMQNFPAGKVSLSTQGPEYFKINGLALAASEYISLRLVVDKGDHHLSGWVSDENGVPLKMALVRLNAKLEDSGIEYLSYRVMGTDSNGSFNFSNLDTVEHLLSVVANGFKDQKIVHKFKSQADNLHITMTP